MEIKSESDALNEIRELEIHLEKQLEESRRQARETVKSARTHAVAMVGEKENELSQARRDAVQEGYDVQEWEKTDVTSSIKLDDTLVRKLAGDILKVIIR